MNFQTKYIVAGIVIVSLLFAITATFQSWVIQSHPLTIEITTKPAEIYSHIIP